MIQAPLPRAFLKAAIMMWLAFGATELGLCQATVAGTTARDMFPDAQVAALAEAAAKGRTEEVDRLIKAGVPVDGLGHEDATPLTFAMLTPNLQGMVALLLHGADPNHCIKDDTCAEGRRPIVLLLVQRQAPDLLEVMLKFGANPNTREPVKEARAPFKGDSLLILSVMSLEKVKVLVKFGADVNLRPQTKPNATGGATAAEVAAGLGQLEVLEYLLDHGANAFDAIINSLQIRSWSPEARPRRLALLKKLKDLGGHLYPAYKPVFGNKPVNYDLRDTPAEWLSLGTYQCQRYAGEQPVPLPEHAPSAP